ncbi:HlyD family secretion protein [Acuticoccus sediminis]|uniref:HlyD family secretion protein n=1 Tax=Acuticoccus sediminis TaxID=2184697 RepID=UPI001CFC86F6|nr:efflux RND transporter periplasmic adaptor subunit [Acuticoccus sediminis]
MRRRRWVILLVLAGVAAAAYAVWSGRNGNGLPEGFTAANGRLEAVEIDVATKGSGRVEALLVDEGQRVDEGQELARMDVAVLLAQKREAEANLHRAEINVDTAGDLIRQQEAERRAADATVEQRKAEVAVAEKIFDRVKELVARGTAPIERLDNATATLDGARAALAAAEAGVAAAEAAVGYARSEEVAARAGVDAAKATLERIKADIDDTNLRSPREGRVQYIVARPGEVLASGGVILNLVDLTDVYMTFFLPTADAGRVALGTDVRLVLDAAPQYVIPAAVSYVADVAQFTPKTVETADERAKLMFRIKAAIPQDLLKKYIAYVKTGLPGTAYVRLDPATPWPEQLEVKLPDE